MARIKKLKENGKTVYPTTIPQAVVDPNTGERLSALLEQLNDLLSEIDAQTLQGFGVVTAGEKKPFEKIPVVGSDGVLEVGRYIDFHFDNTGVHDYNVRLICDVSDKGIGVHLPTKTGTLALEGNYYNLGTMNVSSSTTSSANVSFSSSSAFSAIRTLLNGLSLTTMSNAMPNITLGFSLSTDSGITHYIRAKVCSISRLSNRNYMLIAMYSNPVFYNDNAINVLRITINASSYVCQTHKAL